MYFLGRISTRPAKQIYSGRMEGQDCTRLFTLKGKDGAMVTMEGRDLLHSRVMRAYLQDQDLLKDGPPFEVSECFYFEIPFPQKWEIQYFVRAAFKWIDAFQEPIKVDVEDICLKWVKEYCEGNRDRYFEAPLEDDDQRVDLTDWDEDFCDRSQADFIPLLQVGNCGTMGY